MKKKHILLWLVCLVIFTCSAGALEKISGIAYIYPNDPGQDPNIPGQDPTHTKLTDGAIGAGGGSAVWGQWQGNKAIVLFDLKRRHELDKIEFWTREDSKSQHLGRVDLMVSTDGKRYRRVRTVRNPQEALRENPPKPKIYSFSAENLKVEARYVKLTFYQDNLSPGVYQQVIEEVNFWGSSLPFIFDEKIPQVNFKAKVNTYSSLRLEIGDFLKQNPQITDLRVFVSEEEFRDVEGMREHKLWWYLDEAKKTMIVNGLTPNRWHYLAISAVRADDSQRRYLEPVAIKLPGVLEVEKVGDIFGINAYPNSEPGGAHVRREPELEREMGEMHFQWVQEAGIKYNRWWRNYPAVLIPYVNRGVSYIVNMQNDMQYTKNTNSYGTWLFQSANEPNLHGTKPEESVATIKQGYETLKAVSPENMLAAPAIHGIEAHQWLRDFYEAGGKDYFDAMDVHIYTQSAFPVPEGLAPGSPEGMLLQIARLKEIMAEYGDEDKPLITTETGCPTYTGRSWAVRGMTQEQQANNIVRMHLHLIANGYRRIFWYSLQDEGPDPNNMEHNFGIIDYWGKPKVSYHAYKTMVQQLGETLYDTVLEGVENPYYGYQFKKLDGGGYVSCLWDAAGKSEATIGLSAGEGPVILYDLLGNRKELAVGEQHTITISESPIYLHTQKPVKVLSAKRLPPPPTLDVAAFLPGNVLLAGDEATLTIKLNSTLPGVVQGKTWVEGQFSIDGESFAVDDEMIIQLPLLLPESVEPGRYALKIKVELPKQQVGTFEVFGIREFDLHFWLASPRGAAPKIYKNDFTGDGTEEILLTNEKWEALIAPEFGGRLLLLIDKESKTNQLHADLKEFSRTCTGPGLGLWDALGSWTADLWQAKYDYSLIESNQEIGLNMQATAKTGIKVTKQILLPHSNEYLDYKLKFHNPTRGEVTVNYATHPEFTPGGTADNNLDVIYLPTQGEIRSFPYTSSLGDRGATIVDQGWWAIADTSKKVMLCAAFDETKVNNLRQWWGDEFFNIELSLKPFRLGPNEESEFNTRYFIKQTTAPKAIQAEWAKLK